MYIVLEGVKGSGKSTLLNNLEMLLIEQGQRFATLSPTRPMPANSWWERAAADPDYCHDDQFLQSLYAARSNYHAEHCNSNASLLLGDRSIITSLVTRWPHQSPEDQPAYCAAVRRREHLIPWPDHVIMLTASNHALTQRFAARNRCYGRQDETPARIQQARAAYTDIKALTHNGTLPHTRWHSFNSAQLPPMVLARRVLNTINAVNGHQMAGIPSRALYGELEAVSFKL